MWLPKILSKAQPRGHQTTQFKFSSTKLKLNLVVDSLKWGVSPRRGQQSSGQKQHAVNLLKAFLWDPFPETFCIPFFKEILFSLQKNLTLIKRSEEDFPSGGQRLLSPTRRPVIYKQIFFMIFAYLTLPTHRANPLTVFPLCRKMSSCGSLDF